MRGTRTRQSGGGQTERNSLFRSVFDDHSCIVYRIAFCYLRNSQDANDAMQEVFLKYFRSMDRLGENIRPWLIAVTANTCRNMLRSGWFSKTVPVSDIEELSYDQSFGEDTDLFEAVMRLPEKERIPLHLFYYEGCSNAEIARLLKMNESTVRVRIMRGRERLKRMLKEEQT
ncbi:MAG: sigma-70 family RNA polymerase sigma factor [Ruminococcus sp.]|nr:sigma-70 family RNA polymerase sigma factor [Ruminococcus sp.]